MGQLKHFNNSNLGYHKIICQWARQYGGLFRVRLANVNVRPFVCMTSQTAASSTTWAGLLAASRCDWAPILCSGVAYRQCPRLKLLT